MKNKITLPWIFTSIFALLGVVTIFLPYIEDASLFTGIKAALSVSGTDVEGFSDIGTVVTVVLFVLAGLLVLTLLFALLAKAIPTLIFSTLTLLSLLILNMGFSDSVKAGYGNRIFIASAVLTLVCSVWLLIAKHKVKKSRKANA